MPSSPVFCPRGWFLHLRPRHGCLVSGLASPSSLHIFFFFPLHLQHKCFGCRTQETFTWGTADICPVQRIWLCVCMTTAALLLQKLLLDVSVDLQPYQQHLITFAHPFFLHTCMADPPTECQTWRLYATFISLIGFFQAGLYIFARKMLTGMKIFAWDSYWERTVWLE